MNGPETAYEYKAKVKRWIDGDTVELSVDLGFRCRIRDRFRLRGVDTPELRPRKADFESEELRQKHIEAAKVATARCEELAPVDTYVLIETFKDDQGKYGRWLCRIWIESKKEWLDKILISEGLAEAS